MQTTGTCLVAVNLLSPARVRTPAQDSRSAHGLLYLAAVPETDLSKNTVKAVLTSIQVLSGSETGPF
jgi:hypothetical protein